MSGVKRPAKGLLGRTVGCVQGLRDVLYSKETTGAPFLSRKMLDVEVANARGVAALSDHRDRSVVEKCVGPDSVKPSSVNTERRYLPTFVAWTGARNSASAEL
jgi:hypothetical protein